MTDQQTVERWVEQKGDSFVAVCVRCGELDEATCRSQAGYQARTHQCPNREDT